MNPTKLEIKESVQTIKSQKTVNFNLVKDRQNLPATHKDINIEKYETVNKENQNIYKIPKKQYLRIKELEFQRLLEEPVKEEQVDLEVLDEFTKADNLNRSITLTDKKEVNQIENPNDFLKVVKEVDQYRFKKRNINNEQGLGVFYTLKEIKNINMGNYGIIQPYSSLDTDKQVQSWGIHCTYTDIYSNNTLTNEIPFQCNQGKIQAWSSQSNYDAEDDFRFFYGVIINQNEDIVSDCSQLSEQYMVNTEYNNWSSNILEQNRKDCVGNQKCTFKANRELFDDQLFNKYDQEEIQIYIRYYCEQNDVIFPTGKVDKKDIAITVITFDLLICILFIYMIFNLKRSQNIEQEIMRINSISSNLFTIEINNLPQINTQQLRENIYYHFEKYMESNPEIKNKAKIFDVQFANDFSDLNLKRKSRELMQLRDEYTSALRNLNKYFRLKDRRHRRIAQRELEKKRKLEHYGSVQPFSDPEFEEEEECSDEETQKNIQSAKNQEDKSKNNKQNENKVTLDKLQQKKQKDSSSPIKPSSRDLNISQNKQKNKKQNAKQDIDKNFQSKNMFPQQNTYNSKYSGSRSSGGFFSARLNRQKKVNYLTQEDQAYLDSLKRFTKDQNLQYKLEKYDTLENVEYYLNNFKENTKAYKKGQKLLKKIYTITYEKQEVDDLIIEYDQLQRHKVYTAYVTFESINLRNQAMDMFFTSTWEFILQKCLKKKHGNLKYLEDNIEGQIQKKQMKIQDAPHPGNIEWRNIGIGKSKIFFQFISILISLFLIFVVFAIVFYLEYVSNEYEGQIYDIDCSSYDISYENVLEDYNKGGNGQGLISCYCEQGDNDGEIFYGAKIQQVGWFKSNSNQLCQTYNTNIILANIMPWVIAVVLTIFQQFIEEIYGIISEMERHVRSDHESSSRVFKIFLASFLNTGIVLMLVNYKPTGGSDIFLNGSYSDFTPEWYQDVGTTIVITMFVDLLIEQSLMAFKLGWFVYKQKRDRKKPKYEDQYSDLYNGTKCQTKQEYKKLFGGYEFEVESQYAKILNLVYISFLYSSGIPIMYWIVCLILVFQYWVDKIYLIKMCKRPEKHLEELNIIVSNFLYFIIYLHIIFGIWFYSEVSIFTYATTFERNEALNARLGSVVSLFGQRIFQSHNIILGILLIILLAYYFIAEICRNIYIAVNNLMKKDKKYVLSETIIKKQEEKSRKKNISQPNTFASPVNRSNVKDLEDIENQQDKNSRNNQSTLEENQQQQEMMKSIELRTKTKEKIQKSENSDQDQTNNINNTQSLNNSSQDIKNKSLDLGRKKRSDLDENSNNNSQNNKSQGNLNKSVDFGKKQNKSAKYEKNIDLNPSDIKNQPQNAFFMSDRIINTKQQKEEYENQKDLYELQIQLQQEQQKPLEHFTIYEILSYENLQNELKKTKNYYQSLRQEMREGRKQINRKSKHLLNSLNYKMGKILEEMKKREKQTNIILKSKKINKKLIDFIQAGRTELLDQNRVFKIGGLYSYDIFENIHYKQIYEHRTLMQNVKLHHSQRYQKLREHIRDI
ncbi:hypothetical protein PPERSA_02322 [Pseudocohnilembus persalinus]|uniref:Anoctamin transmembrane domain-containing protein n=1 Tax=Pseudocohnilembus persalinus TaxID=266149 RepID=A0A0V0QU54_PSEPJ|nr:hypothetical protein PPERSA_02322 [Pseudocohnilembus persalinus]|eukprot:KRX05790.1 hypothetical protein PPERSA_02322 [Pseudocohnilembus persalinus]